MVALSLYITLFASLSTIVLGGPHSNSRPSALSHDRKAVEAVQRREAEARYLIDHPANGPPSSRTFGSEKRTAGRCKPRSSSSASAPSQTAPVKPIGNPGGDPSTAVHTIPTSKSQSHSRSHSTTKAHSTTRMQTSTTKSTPTTTSSGGDGGGDGNGGTGSTFHGQGTYYGTGLGACGEVSKDTDMIAAASELLYDTFPGHTLNPNLNPICGRKVIASRGNKHVTVTIVDRCVACKKRDLDFSPAAFKKLAPIDLGRVEITWRWA